MIDKEGHIVTNQHVVSGAESVSVRFADGSEEMAEIVGTDPSTDIAVLDVDRSPSLLTLPASRRKGRSRSETRSSQSAARSAWKARSPWV